MKITLEQHEVLEFIEKLLAMQGMKLTAPPAFHRTKNGGVETTEVTVVCTPSDIPNKCVVCGQSFKSPALPESEPHSHTAPLREETTTSPERPLGPLMEGEIVDPPFGNDAAPAADGEGGGMASIVAQSRVLEAVKTRELEARRFQKPKK